MTGRTAKVDRSTRETRITAEMDLDGSGRFEVESNIQFLKHMVETLARYSSFDLKVTAFGDNEHHIIEDTAITLGKALSEALDGRPIERMATSTVPMDDALVTASLDLVDRPYADIDCPSPEYHHFMRSFAMSSGMTLHIAVMRGFDEHHIIEAGFKALGKALREAVKVRETELSTKDSVVIKGGNRCSRRE